MSATPMTSMPPTAMTSMPPTASSARTPIALETRDLTLRFGGVAAVEGVDFRLRVGEIRCLVGPNGAGKSTFFKCLAGLLVPDAGEIHLHGSAVIGRRPFELARMGIGVKMQTPAVLEGLSAEENMRLAASRARRDHRDDDDLDEDADDDALASPRERSAALLERLDLSSSASRRADELSHGQRQRLEIGMVAALSPSVALLDEPAAGLAGGEVDVMAELVREMALSASVAVVEHDMRFVRAVADTVSVLHRGRLLAEGGVDETLSDPRVIDAYLGRAR